LSAICELANGRSLCQRRENVIVEAKGRRTEEHQEGGEGREAKEDDLEAAEKDAHRTRQRGREGCETERAREIESAEARHGRELLDQQVVRTQRNLTPGSRNLAAGTP
jgi:hypothetical protein